jgi:hypothetical protein
MVRKANSASRLVQFDTGHFMEMRRSGVWCKESNFSRSVMWMWNSVYHHKAEDRLVSYTHTTRSAEEYSSTKIVRVTKWRAKMTRTSRTLAKIGNWWRILVERYFVGEVDIGERIILKWILKEYHVRLWTGFSWHRIRSSYANFRR